MRVASIAKDRYDYPSMNPNVLARLQCPKPAQRAQTCGGTLALTGKSVESGAEVRTGTLECERCRSRYPILAGVALLVNRVRDYLIEHVKGVAPLVDESEIPKEFLRDFREARAEIADEHIEDDLEAMRVNALYVLNHYLRASDAPAWWRPLAGDPSPTIDRLIQDYWDRGPLARIRTALGSLSPDPSQQEWLELGCGVGGVSAAFRSARGGAAPTAASATGYYLGVDSSFASIAIARHLSLGRPYAGELKFPGDLLDGAVSRTLAIPKLDDADGRAEFVVGEIDRLPVRLGRWDGSIALNAIDMLDDPAVLPRMQGALLRDGGYAIQSCPYVWHPQVAMRLRKRLPREVRDSATAVEWLYTSAGLKICERETHLPWLFFKHVRQIELYSVHWFMAQKAAVGTAPVQR